MNKGGRYKHVEINYHSKLSLLQLASAVNTNRSNLFRSISVEQMLQSVSRIKPNIFTSHFFSSFLVVAEKRFSAHSFFVPVDLFQLRFFLPSIFVRCLLLCIWFNIFCGTMNNGTTMKFNSKVLFYVVRKTIKKYIRFFSIQLSTFDLSLDIYGTCYLDIKNFVYGRNRFGVWVKECDIEIRKIFK